METATEEVPEGGENRFVQKYPVRSKYPELTLKRGLLVRSDVFDWIREAIQDFNIVPRDVDVTLLDAVPPAALQLASRQRLRHQVDARGPERLGERGERRDAAALLSVLHRRSQRGGGGEALTCR